MPLCARHERPANKYAVCDQCNIDVERTERDRQREAKDLEKLRDRMALSFAVNLMHLDNGLTEPSEVAIKSYTFADAMLGARTVR